MDLFLELFVSLSGGILTFFSPCLLAVQLGYIVLLAAIFLPNLRTAERFSWRNPFAVCFIFSLGFAFAFILSTYPGYTQRFMMFYHLLLLKIAGGIILYFALAFIQKFRMPVKGKAFFGSALIFLLGASFSVAWTHCLNSVLSMIITISSIPHTAYKGLFLLLVYSFGLGIPFVSIGILLYKILHSVRWFRENMKPLLSLCKIILIVMGIALIFTPWWVLISSYFVGIAPDSVANGIMKEMVDTFIGGYSIIH